MNCEKGDLVRYVGAVQRPNVRGWIGRTVCLTEDSVGDPCWLVSPPLPGGNIPTRDGRYFYADHLAGDENLRPIRPGESPEESTEAMRKLHEVPQEVTT